jgi:hypothetical protein
MEQVEVETLYWTTGQLSDQYDASTIVEKKPFLQEQGSPELSYNPMQTSPYSDSVTTPMGTQLCSSHQEHQEASIAASTIVITALYGNSYLDEKMSSPIEL